MIASPSSGALECSMPILTQPHFRERYSRVRGHSGAMLLATCRPSTRLQDYWRFGARSMYVSAKVLTLRCSPEPKWWSVTWTRRFHLAVFSRHAFNHGMIVVSRPSLKLVVWRKAPSMESIVCLSNRIALPRGLRAMRTLCLSTGMGAAIRGGAGIRTTVDVESLFRE